MNIDYRILLDCHKDGYQAIVPGIKCGDSNTRTLYILLSDSGQPVKISENAIATIFVKKENGETVYGDCTIENDKIVHSIKTNEIDCEGEVLCECRITTEDKALTTAKFKMFVEEVLQDDSAIEAQDSFTALTETLKRVVETEQDVAEALEAASEAQNLAQNALSEAKEAQENAESALEEAKKSAGKVYVVPYYSPSTITEAQKEEIREIITAISAEKGDYALFMKLNNGIIPASYIDDYRYKTVRATLHDSNNLTYQIVLSKAGEVTVSQETIYVMEPEKIESATSKAPTGAAMATYVQDYVAQHGGNVSEEELAAAIEAYFEENPVVTEETDPTVFAWAKEPTKPSYTASEVGALPSTYTPPDQTAEQVGADAKGTADAKVSAHNTSNASHNDIRLLIEGLTTRLNTLANSTDEDLDQLSEIVAYIKSNKSLIDGITTSKVSVSDIINNLTTNVANKPLSAAQGVALKALIDAITVPTKVSAFDNDAGYIKSTELNSAVDDALEEAKESGEFDGDRGFSTLRVTTALSSYTTTTGGFTPKYRIALSTVLSESGASEVLVGDTILRNYYTYRVGYVDSSYVYVGAYASIRGSAGTSVTISSVTESEVSGGENVVTFSDEKTLTIKNGRDGEDGYTPKKGIDYDTPKDRAEIEAYIATELAKRGQLKPEFAQSEEWLDENGDTSKMYVLPDGFIYAWMLTEKEVEGGSAYTNLLPTATDTDRKTIYGGDYNGDGVNDGYITKYRLSSSGSLSSTAAEDCRASGFIPVSVGAVLRIKGTCGVNATSTYVIAYNSANTKTGYKAFNTGGTVVNHDTYDTLRKYNAGNWYTIKEDDVLEIPLTSANFGTDFNAIRFSGYMDENTIVTINEEIKEGGGTEIVTEYAWVSTGLAFVPADYEDRIVAVESKAVSNTKRIIALEKLVENGGASDTSEEDALLRIRNWDKPIYERLTPFLLDADLDIDTTYPKTYTDSQDPDGALRRQNVQAVYDEYNALCTAHPDFVRDITNVEHGLADATETTFGGLCSDGIQYVRVYEFCEREGRHSNTTNTDYWSETKPTFVIVSGIHWEYNGVYSMLHALKLITENPNLRDMRRNCRFIVIPMSNPYCFTTYSNSGGGHYNANGVEIHNNFAVDFNNVIDSTHGTAPLSEVETRYIDNAMRKYADTGVCLLTCHSNATKGSNFIWGSVATKFMCNVSMRLVDLMSYAWDSKYDNYRTAIDTLKVGNSNPQEDGDYRCGFASLSTSTGTETKQALRYGMQGINVEVYEKFYLFDPNGTNTALAINRGAEVYANLLRLLAVTYDHNDKKEYAPNLPWSE